MFLCWPSAAGAGLVDESRESAPLLRSFITRARPECRRRGSVLARIETAGQNAALAAKLVASATWIGLSDMMSEGEWTWAADSVWLPGEKAHWTHWADGQPNDYGSQHCAAILRAGRPTTPNRRQPDRPNPCPFAPSQNIEANHATLAGHSFEHEIATACSLNFSLEFLIV